MEQNDFLMHVGVAHDDNPPGRGSGRLPWGSGDKPFQRPKNFLDRVNGLLAEGKSKKEVAAALGILNSQKTEGSPTRLIAAISIAKNEERLDLIRKVRALDAQGVGATEGAKKLGLPNESSFRSYLKEGSEYKSTAARLTADNLEKIVDKKGNILVGEGTAEVLNISENRLLQALELCYYDGYEIHPGRVPYPTDPDRGRTIKVLCPPGTPSSAGYDYKNIHSIEDEYISHDGVTLKKAFEYPASMDPKRLMVRYGDQGGEAKDGLVEIRPGVKDLDIGKHYAQVRILVDDTHYIKGMAVYGKPEDFPKGVDVIFNTNKKTGTPVMVKGDPDAKQVLKSISNDPNNPFKSALKEHGGQSFYDDPKGKYTDPVTGNKQSLSLINRRAWEGDWGDWSKELPSQFLSKQSHALVQQQLNLTEKQRRKELDDIKALTNDTVKRVLLEKYAQTVDGQSVSLKAASLPGQRYQVILPLTTIKDDEVYAPNYKQGEVLSLVRFPHAGLFEIPQLKVNNKNAEGDRIITKDGLDAIGISANVAKKLSGADFDGDTVLVIPRTSNGPQVRSREALKELMDFDIELEYGDHPGNVHMTPGRVQSEMGIISNLITDMNLAGAPDQQVVRAVKHSMVVIDALKHKYDYKQSEKDNDISGLKHEYQRRVDENGKLHFGGASTIVSAAKSPRHVPYELKEGVQVIDPKTGKHLGTKYIDPETGKKLYTKIPGTHQHYIDPITKDHMYYNPKIGLYVSKKHPDAKPLPREVLVLSKPMPNQTERKAMELTDDAMTLVSAIPNPKEIAYANYANYLKALANEARKETLNLHEKARDPSASRIYAKEVAALNEKYLELQKRKNFEAMADMIAGENYKAWLWDGDNFARTDEEKGKQQQRLLTQARHQVGLTSRLTLEITPREWEAIQAGAIGSSKLKKILTRADIDVIKSYATPYKSKALTVSQINRIRALSDAGKKNSEIADAMGINVSTVLKYLEKGA